MVGDTLGCLSELNVACLSSGSSVIDTTRVSWRVRPLLGMPTDSWTQTEAQGGSRPFDMIDSCQCVHHRLTDLLIYGIPG